MPTPWDNQPLTIVDIETTGLNPHRDHIIEIALLRIEHGELVEQFQTLINPETTIPPDITRITGITTAEVKHAPRFFDIKDDILRLTKDSWFVAHNAEFDYGFLKQSLKRYDNEFRQKRLCTVKLFRHLVPTLHHHNLDSLLDYFQIQIKGRHRALGDALALWEFLQKTQQQYEPHIVETAIKRIMKRVNLPNHLSEADLDRLPESPGVYLMYGEDSQPLYIGKSISIRQRVLSHFASTGSSSKEFRIAHQVQRIETMTTSGELSALLLEAQLVKQHQPIHNRKLRKISKMILATLSLQDATYAKVNFDVVDHISPQIISNLLGVYRSQKQAKDTLLSIAKEHSLCPRLLGLESGVGACFWHQLGWCKGACVDKESVASYNLRFTHAFSQYKIKRWPYTGPIVVREMNEEHMGGVVIDNWCVLGVVTSESELAELANTPYVFDLDTYKILSRFLFVKTQQVRITQLQSQQFPSL